MAAKTRTVTVEFLEAYRALSYGGFTGTLIKNMLTGGERQEPMTYTTFEELAAQVKAAADAYTERKGHGCAVFYIRPRGERKKPGWDKFTKANREFNLTLEPKEDAA